MVAFLRFYLITVTCFRLPSPVQKLSPAQTRSSSPGKSLTDLGQDSVTGRYENEIFEKVCNFVFVLSGKKLFDSIDCQLN